MPHDEPNLERIQRWMQEVITHPRGIEQGIASPAARGEIDVTPAEIEEVITRSRNLTSQQRLAVYGNAYYARLLDCMRGFLPVLAQTLGEELFDQFSFDYLQAYPSHSYTLGRLADNFVRYLEESQPTQFVAGQADIATTEPNQPGWAELLVDLARLELAIDEVFDAPGIEGGGLTPEQLATIDPEAWPACRLRPAPCLRLLELRFPLNEYYTAVRRQGELPPLPAPAASYVALSRLDYIVHRHTISRAQYELLQRLVADTPVGEAIAAVAEHDPDWETLAAQLNQWFQRWTSAGFFAAIVKP